MYGILPRRRRRTGRGDLRVPPDDPFPRFRGTSMAIRGRPEPLDEVLADLSIPAGVAGVSFPSWWIAAGSWSPGVRALEARDRFRPGPDPLRSVPAPPGC
ncbi:MAG: hypothetical protein M0C28_21995 [Candidatus Moduliflexus flocculans]|nr:hypothetical protein [Candidatus Moduliflexus flocculans]